MSKLTIAFGVGFLSALLILTVGAVEPPNIGSGNPGLKVITRSGNPNSIVIYHELPETPFGGSIGVWMTNENIQVIVDHGYRFQKAEMLSLTSGAPLELYPFATHSAFTDDIGAMSIMKPPVWLSEPPEVGYRLIGDDLTTFTNVQEQAQMKYHLHSNEFFLGFVDGKVFFIKDNPVNVFWREPGSQKEYYYHLPRAVIDIFGVTKALDPDKDIGFVVFRHVRRWPWDSLFLAPYEQGFIQISLSKGKLVRPNTALEPTPIAPSVPHSRLIGSAARLSFCR
jgi:hypothetical protein